jgi:iron complex transport system ATP-binding protein
MTSLQVREVCFSYSNGLVLHNVNLDIGSGEMVALIGPNGSGKTTLVKLISGILQPRRGEILLDGYDLSSLDRKQIARNVAVVPQQFQIPFAFTVTDVVLLGRIPYLRAFAKESEADQRSVARVLEITGIRELARRRFDELSGGERQKVILAMALAQETRMLLLDEPTAHLDVAHQVEILELVKSLNRERDLTVIAAIHDLNLASLYFERLVLLKQGRILADGTPVQVLTEDKIREAFSTSVDVTCHPVTGTPQVVLLPSDYSGHRDGGVPVIQADREV